MTAATVPQLRSPGSASGRWRDGVPAAEESHEQGRDAPLCLIDQENRIAVSIAHANNPGPLVTRSSEARGDVGRPAEVPFVFASHQLFAPRLDELTVILELG